MRPLTVVAVFALVAYAGAWNDVFRRIMCYEQSYGDRLEEQMPLSLSNLIAILEKYENQHTYNNIDNVANALIKRYQKNGIVFQPGGSVPWNVHEDKENWKESIIDKTFTPGQIVPEDTYDPREECSLHFMLSHSTDVYPHSGVDNIWDGNVQRSGGRSRNSGGRGRGSKGRGRYKRSRSRQRRPKRPMDSSNEKFLQHSRTSLSQDIGDANPALHPIENGVIYSPMGPLAAGSLLRGIMAMDRTTGITIRTVFGDEVDYMPTEMQNKYLEPVYVTSLAGDIGQAAIASYSSTERPQQGGIGPRGMFSNCTACPKQYSLENGYDGEIAQMTRAEIYAGIDALLIRDALKSSSSSSSSMQLSEILRMYYSEHGMPGKPEYRACNRMNLWDQLDIEKIQEQALNFMYAYSYYWPEIKNIIEQFPDDFDQIETRFQSRLDQAWQDLTNFINNHPYEDYEPCPVYNNNDVKVENNLVDAVIVFGYDGGNTQTAAAKEYIVHLGMKLGVSEKRSRLGVLDGSTADWTFPVTNFSNVADWGCNFTKEQGYGSGFDMLEILDQLTKYYYGYYNELRSKGENARAPTQVIIFNIPSNFDTTNAAVQKAYAEFNTTFRDVYKLFVGKSKGNYDDWMDDSSKDFFQISTSKDMEEFADEIAKRINQVPSLFVYPACDNLNSTWESYNEQSHLYTGYVSPNTTAYIQISPANFRFSGSLKLQFESADVHVCTSREMMNPEPNKEDVHCEDAPYDFEFYNLCGRYISECKPIYLSVFGKGSSFQSCTDDECEFPDQTKFEMRHDGMTCGGLCSLPAPILLLAMLCLALFNWD